MVKSYYSKDGETYKSGSNNDIIKSTSLSNREIVDKLNKTTPSSPNRNKSRKRNETVSNREIVDRQNATSKNTIAVAVGKEDGKTVVKNLEPYVGKEGVKQISKLTDRYGRLETGNFQEQSTREGVRKSLSVSYKDNSKAIKNDNLREQYMEGSVKDNRVSESNTNIDLSYDPIFAPVRKSSGQETINVDSSLTPEDVGFYSEKPVLTLETANISRDTLAREAGRKALQQEGKLTFSELKLLPRAVNVAAYDFTKGFVKTFNPLNIPDAIGSVVTTSAKLATGETTIKKVGTKAYTGFSDSLRTNTFETLGGVTAIVAGPKIIKGIKAKGIEAYSKVEPYKKYEVTEIGKGFEQHKGEFTQYLAKYQGESFTRGGRTVGVRRVETPTLSLLKKNPLEYGISVVEKLKGKKPGQIARFDVVAEDILLRDTPSEFATSKMELGLGGKQTTATSVTQDISFAKDGYKVLGSGGKELAYTGSGSGRMIVGGTEVAQFFAPELLKTSAGVKPGTATANLYYAGEQFSKSGGSKPIKFGYSDPGLVIKTTTPKKVNPSLLRKDYVDLAQDLAGYTEPGVSQLSASTLKGVRTESEILTPVSTITKTTKQSSLYVPGRGNLKVFYGKDIPITTKKGLLSAYDSNIDYLKSRISQAETLALESTDFASISKSLIPREQLNIKRIEIAKGKLLGKDVSSLQSEFSVLSKELKSSQTPSSVSALSQSEFSKRIGDTRSEITYKYVGYEDIPGATAPLAIKSNVVNSKQNNNLQTSSVKVNTMSFSGPSISSISGSSRPLSSSVPSVKSSSKSLVSDFSNFNSSPKSSRRKRSSSGSKRGFSSKPSISSPSSSMVSSVKSFSKGFSNKMSEFKPSYKPSGYPSYKPSGSSSIYTPSRIPSPRTPKNNRSRKENSDFFVEIRQRGLFRKAGGNFSNIKAAFKGGKSIVGEKAAASFRIRDSRTGRIITDLELQGDNTLRKSKKEKGVFIERLGKRIKSGGELKEITYKGINAQRKIL